MKYYAGYADKIHGNTIEIDDKEKSAVTRKEPIGCVSRKFQIKYKADLSAW